MLPIILPTDKCQMLAQDAENELELEVDLEAQKIRRGSTKLAVPFTIDTSRRHRLLNGLDDITLTLQKENAIARFEERRSEEWPWLEIAGRKSVGSRIESMKEQETNIAW